jgi:hypothetical protein
MNQWDVEWSKLSPAQKRRRAVRHYNGTCICYGKIGAVIAGNKATGRNCIVTLLSGPYWEESQRLRK